MTEKMDATYNMYIIKKQLYLNAKKNKGGFKIFNNVIQSISDTVKKADNNATKLKKKIDKHIVNAEKYINDKQNKLVKLVDNETKNIINTLEKSSIIQKEKLDNSIHHDTHKNVDKSIHHETHKNVDKSIHHETHNNNEKHHDIEKSKDDHIDKFINDNFEVLLLFMIQNIILKKQEDSYNITFLNTEITDEKLKILFLKIKGNGVPYDNKNKIGNKFFISENVKNELITQMRNALQLFFKKEKNLVEILEAKIFTQKLNIVPINKNLDKYKQSCTDKINNISNLASKKNIDYDRIITKCNINNDILTGCIITDKLTNLTEIGLINIIFLPENSESSIFKYITINNHKYSYEFYIINNNEITIIDDINHINKMITKSRLYKTFYLNLNFNNNMVLFLKKI